MEIADSHIVKLPKRHEIGDSYKGVALDNEDNVNDLNWWLFNYGIRTAIPILNRVMSFGTTFKDKALEEAKIKVGVDDDGILNETYKYERILDSIKFVAEVGPDEKPSHKDILTKSESFLDDVIADNESGTKRNWVRKIDDEAYIELDKYLMPVMEGFYTGNENRYNKKELTLNDPIKDKKFPWDKEIEEMRVYFEDGRYDAINDENARDFYRAMSLEKRIRKFLKTFKKSEIDGKVPEKGLKNHLHYSYRLGDGTGVTELFYNKDTESYAGIYNELIGKPGEGVITRKTGDLRILKELAFEEPYVYAGKKDKIYVETNFDGKSKRKGRTAITRIYKKKDNRTIMETKVYSVFRVDERMYVKAGDVLGEYEYLSEKYASSTPQVKIDFYPSDQLSLMSAKSSAMT